MAEQAAITAAYEAAEAAKEKRMWRVTLTRDITESCVMEVEADTEDEAESEALAALAYDENPGWEVDDGSAFEAAYATETEEIVPEGVQPMREFIVKIGRDARAYYSAIVEARSISEVKAKIGRHGYTGETKGPWVQGDVDDFDNVEVAEIIDIHTRKPIATFADGEGWTTE
jgi:hypothetical protein